LEEEEEEEEEGVGVLITNFICPNDALHERATFACRL